MNYALALGLGAMILSAVMLGGLHPRKDFNYRQPAVLWNGRQ